MKQIIQIVLLMAVFPLAYAEQRQAEGVLEYYPSDVQSSQAWYGHNFILGDTPIKPSTDYPEERLLRYVGKHIRVKGTWDAGKTQQPDPNSAMPQQNTDAVTRNDGIIVEQLAPLKSN